MRKLMAAGLCAVAFLGFTATAETPSMSTRWGRTQLGQEACLKHAEQRIREEHFQPRPPTATSRYGVKGNYVIAVRCLTEIGMYFLAAAGPSEDRTTEYVEAVDKDF